MDKFTVMIHTTEDVYDIYSQWCIDRGFPLMHKSNVENIAVCYKEDTPIYAVVVWTTKSTMSMIGFPVSNPDVSYEDKKGGLTYLFKVTSEILARYGYRAIWTTSATPNVVEALVESDFEKADSNVDVYINSLF